MRHYIFVLATMLATAAMAQETVALPAAQLYAKALEKIVDTDFVPTFRDAELMLIKTDLLSVKLTEAEVDCGSMFGFSYISDKRTKTAVAHTVRIKSADEANSTIIVTTKIEGYLDTFEGAPFFIEKTRDSTKVLTCKSTGKLERDFVESLKPKAAVLSDPAPTLDAKH